MNKIFLFYIIIILLIYNKITYAHHTILNKINTKAYFLTEFYSGKILTQKNANLRLSPASLTKIMTSYIIGKFLKKKIINNNQEIIIKANASAKKNPIFKNSSLMFLNKNDKVKILDLKKGIIIQSGNDACVAIADHIAQNQYNFINIMNKYKSQMKLNNTFFLTVHGLDKKQQYTSAKDMAVLSSFLIKRLPQEYVLYKKKYFTFNKIKQKNRNTLLWCKYFNIDGIKTGHTDTAKYNLIASSIKKNMRLIAVILGSNSIHDRELNTKKLLNWGFRNFINKKIVIANKILKKKKIWFGEKNNIRFFTKQNIYISIPSKTNKFLIKINFLFYKKHLLYPINKNEIIGKILIKTKENKKTKNFVLFNDSYINQKNIFLNIKDFFFLIIEKIKIFIQEYVSN